MFAVRRSFPDKEKHNPKLAKKATRRAETTF